MCVHVYMCVWVRERARVGKNIQLSTPSDFFVFRNFFSLLRKTVKTFFLGGVKSSVNFSDEFEIKQFSGIFSLHFLLILTKNRLCC